MTRLMRNEASRIPRKKIVLILPVELKDVNIMLMILNDETFID